MKKKQEQQPTKNSRRSHEYVKLEEAVNSRSFFWENWSLGAWSTLVSTPEVQTSLSALWARFLVIEFRADGCYFVRGKLFYYDFFVSFFGVSSTWARRQSFVGTNFLSSHHEISRLLSSTTNSTSNFAGFTAMLSLQNCSLFVTWSLEGSGFTQRRSLSNLWPFRLLHSVLSLSTYLWRACSWFDIADVSSPSVSVCVSVSLNLKSVRTLKSLYFCCCSFEFCSNCIVEEMEVCLLQSLKIESDAHRLKCCSKEVTGSGHVSEDFRTSNFCRWRRTSEPLPLINVFTSKFFLFLFLFYFFSSWKIISSLSSSLLRLLERRDQAVSLVFCLFLESHRYLTDRNTRSCVMSLTI